MLGFSCPRHLTSFLQHRSVVMLTDVHAFTHSSPVCWPSGPAAGLRSPLPLPSTLSYLSLLTILHGFPLLLGGKLRVLYACWSWLLLGPQERPREPWYSPKAHLSQSLTTASTPLFCVPLAPSHKQFQLRECAQPQSPPHSPLPT